MAILDGKLTSDKILTGVKDEIERLKTDKINQPSMAILLVGTNPASESYIRAKTRSCKKSGIKSNVFRYDDGISSEDLLMQIESLNKSSYDGYIVQLPLPDHINKDLIINAISDDKDIDGFTPSNFGKMALGQESFRPATAYGITKLIESYDIETNGKHVVVVGRSNIVGKPISIMLGNDFGIGRATVTSCDINTPKALLMEETKKADIVIVAVGKPNLLTSEMIKEGCVVIDVGINRLESGKLVGDCDFEGLSKKASWITPVPGGVGPMTIAGLILNTMKSWKIKTI